jgi:hypothetical protein
MFLSRNFLYFSYASSLLRSNILLSASLSGNRSDFSSLEERQDNQENYFTSDSSTFGKGNWATNSSELINNARAFLHLTDALHSLISAESPRLAKILSLTSQFSLAFKFFLCHQVR